jgi:hypothetical protein
MTRQEFLLNLTLVTVIGALGYSLYDARHNPTEMAAIASAREAQNEADAEAEETPGPPGRESTYNREKANKKYPKVGSTDLFRPIIPPTPSPPPPTPKPTDTPNIQLVLNVWKVLSVDKGVVTIEDIVKSKAGVEGAVVDMKVGDTQQMDIGGGQIKNVRLNSVDEVTNPDVPTATFSMEGTNVTRTLKMGDEAGGNVNAPKDGAPGAPAPQ